jgi:solute carrier family 25 protein 16
LAKTLVSPLDRVKILFQTGHPEYARYSGSLASVFCAIGAI